MEINGNLDVREIAPRVIDGWSDVRFSDEETTSADFFEAVRQAILERANAVSTSISSGKYPVNTPTFSWGKYGSQFLSVIPGIQSDTLRGSSHLPQKEENLSGQCLPPAALRWSWAD